MRPVPCVPRLGWTQSITWHARTKDILMKPTTCLSRPAIAGIAALGLTTTALLAPAAHANSPASDRPGSFTSAYTAVLVPRDTAPVDAPAPAPLQDEATEPAAPAEAPAPADAPAPAEAPAPADAPAAAEAQAPIQEERTGEVTPVAPPAPAQEDAAAPAAAGVETAQEGTVGAAQEGTAGEAGSADGPAGGGQEAANAASPVDSAADAPVETSADASAPDEASGDTADAPAPGTAGEEAAEEVAPAHAPVPERVTGEVMLWVNAHSDKVCFDVALDGVAAGSAATVHLHDAAGSQALTLPGSSGCLQGAGYSVAQIEADPSAFYVDVHTDQSPEGAARGHLTQLPLGGVDAGGGGTAGQDSALPVAGAVAAAALLGLGGAFALYRRSRGSA